jgi:DNA processing protein
MAAELAYLIEKEAIKPSIEIGAFEALWSQSMTSFKQIRDKLSTSQSGLLSELIEPAIAAQFYEKAIKQLHSKGIYQFGVRIDGTIDYPEKLHDAEYPLALLYYQGNWDLVYTRGVSVVGTRKPSLEGIKRTNKLVKQLVEAGFTIFSGLAAGIDTAAHLAAIRNGGSTVAVIGTPLYQPYPKENSPLQKEIGKNHLLISQVPVVSYGERGIQFNRIFFPERNKTMSALSEATIIVEAGETSGTLIQAKAALKQGRKVFILNSNFENPEVTWPHRLQKAGAIRVQDFSDILQVLSGDGIQTPSN